MTAKRTSRGILVGHLPPPTEFNAPAKFTSWREEQEEALVLLSESTQRVSVLDMPTGSGKALTAYMYAILSGKRALILTETKGLQRQYEEDFDTNAGGELVNISGMNNYPCPALEPGGKYAYLRSSKTKATCDVGPCKSGLPCKLREGGCPGYDKVREAKDARVVSTNYANWLSMGKAKRDEDDDETLGEFDLLILDEVHASAEAVSLALTVELNLNDLQTLFGAELNSPPKSDDFAKWSAWIQHVRTLQTDAMTNVLTELRLARDSGSLRNSLLDEMRGLRRLGKDLYLLEQASGEAIVLNTTGKLTGMGNLGDWVVETTRTSRYRTTITFQPVWPTPYAEKYLFRGIKRIVGMSATVRPKTMEYLGLAESDFDFWEFDSSFPLANRPIYFIPIAFMRYGMSESELERWARGIDSIAKSRPANGIVHTVSYERARYYQKKSELKHRLMENTPDSTARTVEKFKQSRQPLVLVSPSIATGYDFPDDTCRWQVIGKVPFPDRRSKIMQRRCSDDPTYPNYLAMLYIVQAAGRSTRSPSDWSEVFIVDGVFGFGQKGGFYEKNKQYAPKSFREALKRVNGIPKFRVRPGEA